jgi:putative spermidine/putrescine transport system substrate-binding protein
VSTQDPLGTGLDLRLTRRTFLQAGALSGAAAFLAACAGPGATSSPSSAGSPTASAGVSADASAGASFALPDIHDKDVVVVDFGGKSHDAGIQVIDQPFMAKTGAVVLRVGDMDLSKLYQMIENNAVEWDAVLLAPEETPITSEFLEPLDYRVINPVGIPKEGILDYGIASDYYSVVLVWRTDKYTQDTAPKSWKDFWDVDAFPGRRTLPRRTIDIVELALMGDSVDPASMYPLDIDRAEASIKRIQPNIAKFWSGGNEPIELLLTGEVDLAAVWATRVVAPVTEGAPIDFTWNQHLMSGDILGIPKGSKHVDAAMQWIDFRIKPEQQGALANLVPTAPSSPDAYQFVDEAQLRFLPTATGNIELGHLRDPKAWNPDFEAIDERIRQVIGV